MEINRLKYIADNFKTPTYIFEVKRLKERVDLIREMLPPETKLCFAMKANPFLVKPLEMMVDRIEVCSPGEYEICIRENILPEKIVVSGVCKTIDTMERIISYSKGEGIYTIESEEQYRVLKDCSVRNGLRFKVLLRLSSGNQFGMDKEVLESVALSIKTDNIMDLVGIHYYSGTQKKSKKVRSELMELEEYSSYIKEKLDFTNLELEYGPGLMESYFENNGKADIEAADVVGQLEFLNGEICKITEYSGVSIELGRFLTSSCGYYLTRIMDVKCTNDTGFVIVDGGIHHINYYGQLMGMKKPYMQFIQEKSDNVELCGKNKKYIEKWNICGALCTVNDIITRDVSITDPQIGDIIVFENCGAYSVTEGMSLFLSRELPQILLVNLDGEVECLRGIIETNIFNSGMEDKSIG